MEPTLTNFEQDILLQIAHSYPFLHSHIPLLQVKSRERTGVGMYVNFNYLSSINDYPLIPSQFYALSGNAHLHMKGLEHGLVYEISISNGRIDFIELVSYGEPCDGEIRNFSFEVNS